jgi:two-component system NtrC family sensor kinase
MIDQFRTQVEHHSRIINLFLRERRSKLQLIAQTHSIQYLGNLSNLRHVFDIMNREYGSMTDLGVINDLGTHVAYVGPYDLMDKNYAEADWFKKVMEQGVYISDMFLGFRKVPHFIIAVVRFEDGKRWILRATIDTEIFRSLVENVEIGRTGEVYLVNKEGTFQTRPQHNGKIMEKSPLPMEKDQEGITIQILENEDTHFPGLTSRQIIAQTWIDNPKWMLVVRQEYSEAFDNVNHANISTLMLLHISAVTILIVAIGITKHMIKMIQIRDQEADQLNKQLLQTSKLASIGELSAGVAHEINNPLAIILTERQILLDLMDQTKVLDAHFREQLIQSLSQIDTQVLRCRRITQNLLRFSRRTRSIIETVDINAFIKEVVELMEREARSSGITFDLDMDESLPPMLSDPSQLQQVFLNLITNAIDAHDGKSYASIRIMTHREALRKGLEIRIADTGTGISPEHLDRIFDPFFTTKPVGKGTGLGLSICYSIIKSLGGHIRVQSEVNKGTEFIIFLPDRIEEF